jgi:hypothetical protein
LGEYGQKKLGRIGRAKQVTIFRRLGQAVSDTSHAAGDSASHALFARAQHQFVIKLFEFSVAQRHDFALLRYLSEGTDIFGKQRSNSPPDGAQII